MVTQFQKFVDKPALTQENRKIPDLTLELIDRVMELLDQRVVEISTDTLPEPLTGRELDILRLLAAGFSNPAIAQRLIIAVGTVKAHTSSIYSKLGVNSRVQAINEANKRGLL